MSSVPPEQRGRELNLAPDLIALALQQLDEIHREHNSAGTDALAVIGVDAGLGVGLVIVADAHKFPPSWWYPLIGIALSIALAYVARVPLRRSSTRKWLGAGLTPDIGPEPQALLTAAASSGSGPLVMLALVDRSVHRSAESLGLRTRFIFAALVAIVVDAGASAVLFWPTS